MEVITLFLIAVVLFFVWKMYKANTQESFTPEQTQLAQSVVDFLQIPQTFPTFISFLTANNNTSTKLATLDAFKHLSTKSNLTIEDVVAQM